MTRDDIIKKIQIKMDITPGTSDYYDDMFDPLIDEALSVIANTVLPYQNQIVINYGGVADVDDPSQLDVNKYYSKSNGGWWYYDTSWHSVDKSNLGFPVKIPLDLMSFSDESLIEFKDFRTGDVELDAPVIYLNRDTLVLPKDGSYRIVYNSEYPSITTVPTGEIPWLPRNVGNIIPSYVASQLYASEDMTRSVMYKNEFETMLSRLDDNKPLVSHSINNSSGWTL